MFKQTEGFARGGGRGGRRKETQVGTDSHLRSCSASVVYLLPTYTDVVTAGLKYTSGVFPFLGPLVPENGDSNNVREHHRRPHCRHPKRWYRQKEGHLLEEAEGGLRCHGVLMLLEAIALCRNFGSYVCKTNTRERTTILVSRERERGRRTTRSERRVADVTDKGMITVGRWPCALQPNQKFRRQDADARDYAGSGQRLRHADDLQIPQLGSYSCDGLAGWGSSHPSQVRSKVLDKNGGWGEGPTPREPA
eukprot:825833-Rhodomonas_salina.4